VQITYRKNQMTDQRTPQNATELFQFYRHHMPGMMDRDAMPVVKKGLAMMVAEWERLVAVEKLYEELKANRAAGRPLGRPPKDGKDE
jgi:hypothetical protein